MYNETEDQVGLSVHPGVCVLVNPHFSERNNMIDLTDTLRTIAHWLIAITWLTMFSFIAGLVTP
jgi:hypothetical protein